MDAPGPRTIRYQPILNFHIAAPQPPPECCASNPIECLCGPVLRIAPFHSPRVRSFILDLKQVTGPALNLHLNPCLQAEPVPEVARER